MRNVRHVQSPKKNRWPQRAPTLGTHCYALKELLAAAAAAAYMIKARYTPPTRRNCRVESRRRCVRNSQLVGHSFDESEQIWQQRVELHRVGTRRQSSWASCELCCVVLCCRRNATVQSSRVGVGGVYWSLCIEWTTSGCCCCWLC